MARKRMFDSEIIGQDSFLDLPKECIALYFLLGMEADDEGFVSPRKVMRMYNISEDTLKIIIAKNYIIPFETGVVVITDWKRNNYLDKNRIKETIYQKEKSMLGFDETNEQYYLMSTGSSVKQMLNNGLTDVKQTLNQNRVEESSIEENRVEENSIEEGDGCVDGSFQIVESDGCVDGFDKVIDFYNNNIGLITQYTKELLEDYAKSMDCDVIIYAMQLAVEANVRTVKYIKAILNSWVNQGITTLLVAQEENQKHRNPETKSKQETQEEKNVRRAKEIEEAMKNAIK